MTGVEQHERMAVSARERPDDVAMVLGALSDLVIGEDDLPSTLRKVLDLAVRTIPGCDAGGVTLLAGGRPQTAAWTDERTLAVDQEQYVADDGPCLDAYRRKVVNRVDVDEAAERWPAFAAAAKTEQIRSFLAAPLVVRDEAVGSLNLYSRSEDGFDALDEAFVALFTGPVATAVAGARRFGEVQALAGQLSEAIASRAGIEQAKGILMERHRIDADAAFEALRQESQRRNVKLRDIAAQVVSSAEAPSKE